jgi:hypothetical protein
MTTKLHLLKWFAFAVPLVLGSHSFAGNPHNSNSNKVKPGEFVVEPTTLINAGFEWYVEGDDNHNATVEVWYRPTRGNPRWQQGMDLLRIQNELAVNQPYYTYVSPNMFAGSIFDLQPDTEYEAQFVMSDPDGVAGDKTQTVRFRT